MMGKKCIIVSACPVSAEMKCYVQDADYVIACDAGYRNLTSLGINANVMIGDFDSAPKPEESSAVIVLPHVKDDTDTLYAVKHALQKGFQQIVLLGGLGGTRLSHTLANIDTALYAAEQGAEVTIADEKTEIRILLPGSEMCLPKNNFAYFSVFPLNGPVQGLTIQGAFYNTQNATLVPNFPIGVSNEIVENKATLSISSGALAVVLDS